MTHYEMRIKFYHIFFFFFFLIAINVPLNKRNRFMPKTVRSLAPFQGTMPTIGSARLALLLGGRRGVGDRHLEEPRGGHEVGIQQGLLELQRTRAPLQQVAEGQGGFAHQPGGGGADTVKYFHKKYRKGNLQRFVN